MDQTPVDSFKVLNRPDLSKITTLDSSLEYILYGDKYVSTTQITTSLCIIHVQYDYSIAHLLKSSDLSWIAHLIFNHVSSQGTTNFG